MTEQKSDYREAFRKMWGNYPTPVYLVNRARDLVAVNTAAEEMGAGKIEKCYHLNNSNRVCPNCQGNKCLKEQRAYVTNEFNEKCQQFISGYWIPVADEPDLFVHFGNDITPYVREELLG